MDDFARTANIAFTPEARNARKESAAPFWPLKGIIPDALMNDEDSAAYFRRIQTEIADNEAALADFWLESFKQSDSMLASWMKTQQQLGDAWYRAMMGLLSSDQYPASDRSDDVTMSWQGTASNAVRLQNEWVGLWAAMMGCRDRPNPTSALVDIEAGASQAAATPSPV